jgi:hypothetical protein
VFSKNLREQKGDGMKVKVRYLEDNESILDFDIDGEDEDTFISRLRMADRIVIGDFKDKRMYDIQYIAVNQVYRNKKYIQDILVYLRKA